MKEEISSALEFYDYSYSEKNLHKCLEEFCKTHLRYIDQDVYHRVKNAADFPSARTITRALGFSVGTPTPVNVELVHKIARLFLEKYKEDKVEKARKSQFSFNTMTMLLLASKANNICSNEHHISTLSEHRSNKEAFSQTGTACMIKVPDPLSPRYTKMKQREYMSVANGIWFCADCGKRCENEEYTTTELVSWKNDWERYVKEWANGKKTPKFGLLPDDSDKSVCKRLLMFIEKLNEFFDDVPSELALDVHVKVVKAINGYINKQEKMFVPFSVLDERAHSINRSCRYFLRKAKTEPNARLIEYSYKALRKAIGLNLYDLHIEYKLVPGSNIKKIMPIYPNMQQNQGM